MDRFPPVGMNQCYLPPDEVSGHATTKNQKLRLLHSMNRLTMCGMTGYAGIFRAINPARYWNIRKRVEAAES